MKPTFIYPACDIYVLIEEWFSALGVVETTPVERGHIGEINRRIRHILAERNDHVKFHVV